MKLKTDFIINELLDNYFALGVAKPEDVYNKVLSLNETAKFIFELIQQGKDEDAIVSSLLSEYEITEKEARNEVDKLVATLRENDLIED